ncbi:MAG TPA: hypothetical protein VK541_10805 [Pedobacter sp.]|uniref:hypothetical protein n=1 Tax=Pedobacter sp. TaxID=1411316 RepID=UPI002C2E12E0|nr:hypothetical protein [Pedobacter sp.]HMI02963.1 hypothetical protein [Pedobacter sp.]
MKAAAFFLMICMTFVSVLPGKGQALVTQEKMACCKETGKVLPCDHRQKQDCKHGMCLTRFCCNVSGFVPVKPLDLGYVLPESKKDLTVDYVEGQVSDYSAKSFHPPRV